MKGVGKTTMDEKSSLAVTKTDGARHCLDPVEMLYALEDDLQDFLRDPFRIGFKQTYMPRSTASFMPRMDTYEEDNTIVVKAELPGVKKEDVQLEMDDDNGLIIRGESHVDRQTGDHAYYRAERSAGSFYRRLRLPFKIDPDQIQASLTDGVLEVRIPRPAQVQSEPKKIPVA